MLVRINGERHYLWRAVDPEGEVLEVFATQRRDRRAALKFLKRTMKRYGQPCSIVTDRLRSYSAAMKALGKFWAAGMRALAETTGPRNSHQPFSKARRGDGAVSGDIKTLQKVLPLPMPRSTNHFNHQRHLTRPRHFQTTPSRHFVPVEPTASLTVLKKRFRRIESVSLTVPADGQAGPRTSTLRELRKITALTRIGIEEGEKRMRGVEGQNGSSSALPSTWWLRVPGARRTGQCRIYPAAREGTMGRNEMRAVLGLWTPLQESDEKPRCKTIGRFRRLLGPSAGIPLQRPRLRRPPDRKSTDRGDEGGRCRQSARRHCG